MTGATREGDPLEHLSGIERVSFRLGDAIARRWSKPAALWRWGVPGTAIWLCSGRRLHVHGLEHLAGLGSDSRVILMANHRSFFDLYVIIAVIYWRTQLPQRIFCPVRSTFFYDHPLGAGMNLVMSGMSMFPPILRDSERGAQFNKLALRRCIEELRVPGTTVGLHPEGTRNKGDDPYDLLPAQPGVGRIAIDAEGTTVIPIFVHGITNRILDEARVNWMHPSERPIDLIFGPRVDLEDLRANGSRPANWKRAADRCRAAILKLAEAHRAGAHRTPR